MKRKVLIGAVIWLAFISIAHVTLNVGWAQLKRDLSTIAQDKRQELVVGFLPVT